MEARWWRLASGLAAIVLLVLLEPTTPPARAAPPPSPLPWTREYAPPGDDIQLDAKELFISCSTSKERGVYENDVTGAPTIAVVGDSVDGMARAWALQDPSYHWVYATHCGENYGTALSSGRLDDALWEFPDVLMFGFGTNNFTRSYVPYPELIPWFQVAFALFLEHTDDVPCRVLFNVPDVPSYVSYPGQEAIWTDLTNQMNATLMNFDRNAHRNIQVVDWKRITEQQPWLLTFDGHLTHAGVNARLNLTLEASRRCFPPDDVQHVQAVAGNGTATVWWDPLPEPEGITSYRVVASTGQTAVTRQPTVNVPGLTNGVPVSFTVTATNQRGTSATSAPSAPITPSALGARFHALAPARVLDTRTGQGGKGAAFSPKDSSQFSVQGALPPEAANASAVVLNVTATGQTEPTFLTVWPGDQSRPLASSSNPAPGLEAIPASVTTRTGPGQTVQLFNNSGFVHAVVDVVGWYDAPGSGAGALFTPVKPERVLDTRDGTGGKNTPFGSQSTHTLHLGSLPAGARGAVLNVTSTNTTHASFVTIYPSGTTRPLASSSNPQPHITRANLTYAKTDANHDVAIFNNSSTTDLVIDLVGYFGAEGAPGGGSEYFPMTPERHYDTRDGTGGVAGPVSNTAPISLPFAGRGSVPPSAAVVAVDANLTVTDPRTEGHTSVWPTGPIQQTSSVNYRAFEVVPNRDLIGLSGGQSLFWSTSALIHYIVDVGGWFGPVLQPAVASPATAAPELPAPAPLTPDSSSATAPNRPESTAATRRRPSRG